MYTQREADYDYLLNSNQPAFGSGIWPHEWLCWSANRSGLISHNYWIHSYKTPEQIFTSDEKMNERLSNCGLSEIYFCRAKTRGLNLMF